MVPEEGEDGDDRLGGDVEGELVLVDGELLHVAGEGGEDVLPVLVQRGLGPGHCLGGVHADRLLEGRNRRLLQPARGHGERSDGRTHSTGRAEGEEGGSAGHCGGEEEEGRGYEVEQWTNHRGTITIALAGGGCHPAAFRD